MATKIAPKKQNTFDGWNNIVTGMGNALTDKKQSTRFCASDLLDFYTLDSLYTDGGLARRIIDILPDDMLRKGFAVEGDSGELIESRLEEIGGLKEIELLLKWNRLYGGAICVMGIDDGAADLSTPVNMKGIRNLIYLKTYDRHQVQWSTGDLYTDPNHPKYGQVQFYHVYPSLGLASFTVHESRAIAMHGASVPDRVRSLNQGWGVSVLQYVMDQLKSVGSGFDCTDSILEDFITNILSVKNLADMMYAGEDKKVRDRVEMLDLTKHIINTVLLDADNEQYIKSASSVAGLCDILDRIMMMLSAVTGIPGRKLYGRQIGGLNNTGEGETQDWLDQVVAAQENDLKPVLEKVCKIIFLAKDGAFRGIEPKDWSIEFECLTESTEKEEAEIKKINSESDKNYIEAGVLDPAEVAIARFGGEVYGDIKLIAPRATPEEPDNTPEPVPAPTRQMRS